MTPLHVMTGLLPFLACVPDTVPRMPEWEDILIDETEILAGGGSEYLNELDWLSEHPFDLNRITRDQLLSLPGLNVSMTTAFLEYRNNCGRFRSVAELRRVPDVGDDLYRSVHPYVSVSPARARPPSGTTARLRTILSDPPVDDALGPPVSGYARLVAAPLDGLEAGLVAEKDQGEPVRYGFGGGYLKGVLGPVEIVAGDFSVEAGQGLVIRSGSTPGKSSLSAARAGLEARGVVPHRSAEELKFLRGVAVSWNTYRNKALQCSLIAFYSSRDLPASVDTAGTVTGVPGSGSLTTAGRVATSRALHETVAGLRVSAMGSGECTVGATFLHSRYDHTIRHADPLRMSGSTGDAWGIDFRYEPGIISLFGETARSDAAAASLVGMAAAVGRRADLLVLWRSYSPRYDNPHAMAFGDGSDVRNESGVYAGFMWEPLRLIRLRGYADQFRRIAPTPAEPIPGDGKEAVGSAEILLSPSASLTLDIRARTLASSYRTTGGNGWETDMPAREHRRQWRCSLRQTFGRAGAFRLRIANVRANDAGGTSRRGILFSHEISLKPSTGFTIAAGLAIYSTDGYAARVYDAEGHLPGLTALVTLSGKGRRWFVAATAAFIPGVSLHAVVSGLEGAPSLSGSRAPVEIPSSRSWRAGVQCDVRLDQMRP